MQCSRVRFFPAVKSRSLYFLAIALAMIVGTAALHSMKGREGAPAPERDMSALMGGYRTFAADCLWLETNLAWETRDALAVRKLIDFTVSADPHTPYFWLNGARVLAYDFPAWRCQDECDAPLAVQSSWRVKGASEALLLLERGQKWHGQTAALHLEMGTICLYALRDRARAAEHFRRASEQADAPEYAARIYASLHAEEIAGMTLTR